MKEDTMIDGYKVKIGGKRYVFVGQEDFDSDEYYVQFANHSGKTDGYFMKQETIEALISAYYTLNPFEIEGYGDRNEINYI
jgi:hypothetical protein